MAAKGGTEGEAMDLSAHDIVGPPVKLTEAINVR